MQSQFENNESNINKNSSNELVEDLKNEDFKNTEGENLNNNQEKLQQSAELIKIIDENNNLKKQNNDLNDKFLRLYAEMQNLQRRNKEELEKSIKFASNNFISDLIPTIENFFLACDNSSAVANSEIKEVATFFQAIEMTKKELIKSLEKHQVARIYPKNESFNHNLHEAISQIATNEHEEGTVIEVIQAGYKIHDRLIKPALVVVAKSA